MGSFLAAHLKLFFILTFFLFTSEFILYAQQNNSSKHPYASEKPMPEPVEFIPGAFGSAITPDGCTFYFAKNNPSLGRSCIMKINYQDGKWSSPDTAEFSGQYSEGDPFISPDGSKIFFWSARPVGNSPNPSPNINIWMAEKMANGFGRPVFLGDKISVSNAGAPTVSANGTLYFFSSGSGSGRDIYKSEMSNGSYLSGVNLREPVNSMYDDFDSYISSDESYILISSDRPGSYGTCDIYISFNTNGVWSKPMNLGDKINSPAPEFCPIVSPDGNYLFFTSYKNGTGSIYQIDFKPLLDSLKTNIDVEAFAGLNDVFQIKAPILLKDKTEKIIFSETPSWLSPFVKKTKNEKLIFNRINTKGLKKGIHKAKVTFFTGSNTTDNNEYSVTLNIIEPNPALNVSNLQNGLKYQYYEDTTYRRIPEFNKVVAKKTGTASNIDLSVRDRDTLFALVFNGYMDFKKTAMYTFSINSDDGSRLYIDDKLVIDNDGLHAPMERYGTACLEKGLHKIRMEYIQGKQGSTLEMFYEAKETGIERKQVSNEELFYQ